MNNGHNVLIHCLAGCHRAGTSGVAWLMYKEKLNQEKATKLAKSRREQIDPIGNFPKLLSRLEKALGEDGLMEAVI